MPNADTLAVHLAHGRELRLEDRLEEALPEFEAALRLDSQCARAHAGHGATLARLGHTGRAFEAYWEALHLQPVQPNIYGALAQMYREEGHAESAVDCLRQAVAQAPGDELLRSNFLYMLNFDPRASPAEIFREHCEFGRYFEALEEAPPARWRPKRRLSIGYVSGDFRDHPVSYFFEPLLEHHRRDAFQITLYSSTPNPDFLSERLQNLADRWHDASEESDEELARIIRRDGIDILVDLSSHTSIARPGTFARKPAPVQVNYLGYPNTSGLPAIDYRITDEWADPPGLTERWHMEKLVRLPGGFLCFRVPDDSPAVGKAPCLHGEAITFGSCSKPAKWNRGVIEAWAAILRQTADARLLLHHSTACNPAGILESFFSHGISPDRIDTAGAIDWKDHWSWFHQVDLALDPFPYNGTTASCETLWMGVPFITLAGRTHVERVGASLLTRIGLESLVARNVEEYIALAVRLAAGRPSLASLRVGMRRRMRNSTLLDGAAFTRHLESAYRKMWTEAGVRDRVGAA
jgi:protein O-GlcNAc transferase